MSYENALAAFVLITIATLGMEIMTTYATQGLAFGFSSNRPPVEKSGFALRVARTFQNQVESAAYVVPALVLATLSDAVIPGGALVALLIVLGRAAYVPLYYSGVPFIRVPVFGLGTLGSLYLAYFAWAG
ncbi:MAPEG family protein [Roseibium aggregatum]|uniref:MAPEG family protein n=1 Tax=Roseibium aggregatum TaxID=187304 RepID=A0A926P6L6_9HYPH|nr:MAPEG family protein [Roseibium aggregatum]MBD1549641.1 MAPEG family protein [Roseibium aggregatum]